MGQALISQLLSALEKLDWSGTEDATPAGFVVYKTAIDQVDGYRGDPQDLAAALRTLHTADSLPYAYAGVAYVLLAAAKENGTYAQEGLDAALSWLEQAQEFAPDLVDVNVIEALIYIYGDRLDDARLVLDYLQGQAPDNYFVRRAEMTYWQHAGDHEEALEWSRHAMDEAETVPQRLRLKSVAADLYLQAGDRESALQSYKEALHFNPDNAWLCHQISVLYYEDGDLEEAASYNERALKLDKELAEAKKLRETLSGTERSSGLLGRFFN